MKKYLVLGIIITLINCKTLEQKKYPNLVEGIYAEFQTTQGEILVKFHDKEAPVTVANFVGLAEGKIKNTAKKEGEPFYNGTVFHRIIKNFMIQGGDPKGTGMGDPGYKFDDEINDLKHTKKGILSMANSGPNSNGSQFFITEVATPWLDGKHTIFGEVVQGLEIVDCLSNVKTGSQDKPIETQNLITVAVFTVGNEYKNYDAATYFNEHKDKIKANNQLKIEQMKAEAAKKMEVLKAEMQTTTSGLKYKITQATEGANPAKGANVKVHYKGMLEDGTVFDSSYNRGQPLAFSVGIGQVIAGWDEGILLLKKGEKATFWIPSDLAYGARGAGGVIPPNANLIFEVELVDF